jgi:hypothetical protein
MLWHRAFPRIGLASDFTTIIEASGKCSHGLINLPLAERDREAVQAAPPASRMCTGGAQKRWKINTIDATHNSASPVDAVVFEHRGAFSGP